MLTDAQIARNSRKIKRLDERMNALKEQKDALQSEILHEMEHRGTTGLETHGYRITYVAPIRQVYDEELLHTKLGATRWKIVTKLVLDKDLLAAAVSEGKVRPQTVASCVTEIPSKPYLRISDHTE